MKLLAPPFVEQQILHLVPPGNDGILISYLWPTRIGVEELARYKVALNFHPAPLPEYRGFAPYTWGILNGAKEWGVSAHHMVEEIDAGPLVAQVRWPIDTTVMTAFDLRAESHRALEGLLREVVGWLRWVPAVAPGHYYSRAAFETARRSSAWPADVMSRAFFCPPYAGWEPTGEKK